MGDASALVGLPPPDVTAGQVLYLTGEDALKLTAFNANAGLTLTLRGRFLPAPTTFDPTPRVTTFTIDLVPASDRTASTRIQPLGEGWLLEASVVVSVQSPSVGRTYARLDLVRGTGAAAVEFSLLAQGYVTSKQKIGWPGSPMASSVAGDGALRSISGTTPGAGVNIFETVPTGARWELISLIVQLVTSVAVANRLPRLQLDDGANVWYFDQLATALTASLSTQLGWAQGLSLGSGLNNNTQRGALPINNRLAQGSQITTLTTAIQGADQYGAPQYLVREWIEGA